MPLISTEQYNFNKGQLSDNFLNRVETETYRQGALRLDNCLITPQGTLAPLPRVVREVANTATYGVLTSSFCDLDQQPWVVAEDDNAYWVCLDLTGLGIGHAVSPDRISADIRDLNTGQRVAFKELLVGVDQFHKIDQHDTVGVVYGTDRAEAVFKYVQVGDVVIFVHPRLHPIELRRVPVADGVDFELKFLELDNKPQYRPSGASADEDMWSKDRGFPQSVCIHGGRLWFGGTPTHPQTVWGSRSGEYFDFDHSDDADDYGIQFTTVSREIDIIRHLVSGLHLIVMTTDDEKYCPAEVITPHNFTLLTITPVGCHRYIPPVSTENGVLYINAEGNTLYELTYNENEGRYRQEALNVHAEPLVKPLRLTRANSLQHAASERIHVSARGEVRVLNRSRDTDVLGWTTIKLGDDDTRFYHEINNKIRAYEITWSANEELYDRTVSYFQEVPDNTAYAEASPRMEVETMPIAPYVEGQSMAYRVKRPARLWVFVKEAENLEVKYAGRTQTLLTEFNDEPYTGRIEKRMSGYDRTAGFVLRPRTATGRAEILGWSCEIEVERITR